MLKSKDKLTIVLTPEHLTMARTHGNRVLQAERLDLNSEKWDDSWGGGLHQFDQPLRQLLARFGGSGKKWDADLFYTSPNSICRVDITKQDRVASVAEMVNVLRQTVGRSHPADALCLHSNEQSSLVLGVADTESNLQKLFAWLNRSNVSVDQMLPVSSSVVRQAVIRTQNAPDDSVVLYLSGRSSVIAFSDGGSMKLIRLIDLGYDSLADVYRRAMAQHDMDQDSENQNDDQESKIGCSNDAVEMLFKHGIPLGQKTQSEQLKKIMPSLAPVLQRISIEIKQTLRFASSIETLPLNLRICGPGAAIPQIGVALGQSLDLHVDTEPAANAYEPDQIFGNGTDERAAACDSSMDIEILPKAAHEIRTRKGLDIGLRIGGFVAAVFLGGQFFYVIQKSGNIESQITDQSNVIQRIESDRDRRHAIRSMAGSIGAAATLIEETMGNQTDWVGLLSGLPDEDGDLIRINEIQGQMNGTHPVLNLTGMAVAETEGSDASQVLSRYIKSLKENMVVKRIEIGSTSRSRIDESTWGLNFVLSIELVSDTGRFSELTTLRMVQGD